MLREMSGDKDAGDQSMISMVRLNVLIQSVTASHVYTFFYDHNQRALYWINSIG